MRHSLRDQNREKEQNLCTGFFSTAVVRQVAELVVRHNSPTIEAHQPVDVKVTEPVEVTKRGSAEIDTIEAPESIFRLAGKLVEPQ